MKRILLLMICLFIIVAASGNEHVRVKVTKEARIKFQNMWKEERAKRIPQVTTALGLSFAATYAFGLVGLAGHFNWINESLASYSPLFFNLSLGGAALTWHYHTERVNLIKKKRLSEEEIYAIYLALLSDPKQRMNHA